MVWFAVNSSPGHLHTLVADQGAAWRERFAPALRWDSLYSQVEASLSARLHRDPYSLFLPWQNLVWLYVRPDSATIAYTLAKIL